VGGGPGVLAADCPMRLACLPVRTTAPDDRERPRARGPRARFRPAHRANPRAPRLRREDPRPRRPHPSTSRGPSSARGPSRATAACWSTVRQPGPIAGFYQRIKARRGQSIAIVAFHPSSETGVSAAPAEAPAHRGAAAARLAVIEVAALPPSHCVSARKRPQTCARTILSRVPRAIAIRPADEALVRCHRAAARWLQACQGGRRAPPRRRAGTAHELPRLRRLRAALQLLRASFRVGTPRPRVVPGMSDDGRAVAPPLTDPHALGLCGR
jgi:hypothetical protein